MSRDPNILIISTDAPTYQRLLRDAGWGDHVVAAMTSPDGWHAGASSAKVVLGDPDLVAVVLDRLTHLEWVQSTWAGVRPLLAAEGRGDYTLTGVKDVFGAAMAEYVFCFALMHARNRLFGNPVRTWDPTPVEGLRGKTMGILGVGSIGARVARTAKHFGMHTVGVTRTSRNCACIDRYRNVVELDDMVSELDFLVSLLPDTEATADLLNEDVFAAMKPSALLINAGRANVIDDHALVKALEHGSLAGAVLDVFREEPLPITHPFWSAANVIITSHTAAVTVPADVVPLFIGNLERFLCGSGLQNVIDRRRGY